MTDEQLSQPILAKWGKVAAIICASILTINIIGLVLIALVIATANMSQQAMTDLIVIRTWLIGFSAAVFVMMLVVIAKADTTPSKGLRQLTIGFIGWYVLSGVSIQLLLAISRAQPQCSGFGECMGRGLLGLGILGASQIGLGFVLAFLKRWLILIGMVLAFIMAFIVFVLLYGWPL